MAQNINLKNKTHFYYSLSVYGNCYDSLFFNTFMEFVIMKLVNEMDTSCISNPINEYRLRQPVTTTKNPFDIFSPFFIRNCCYCYGNGNMRYE